MYNKTKSVDILVVDNTILEALAIRSALESFNIKVQIYFIGNVNQLVALLSRGQLLNEIVIICCHGTKGKLLLPELDTEIDKSMTYSKYLTPNDCSEFIRLNNQIIINTGCCLGEEEFSKAFLNNNAQFYIGSTNYPESVDAIYFVISFLYFYFSKNYDADAAFNKTIDKDENLRDFKLYSSKV